MWVLLVVLVLAIIMAICWRNMAASLIKNGGGGGSKKKESEAPAEVEGCGNETKDIVQFLHKAPIDDIKASIMKKLTRLIICPSTIGRGVTSMVYVPEVPTKYNIDGKSREIAVKVASYKDQLFSIDIIDKTLYITGYACLTTELLMLMLIQQLSSPHLPRLVDYGTCTNGVTRIVAPLYGRDGVAVNLYDSTMRGSLLDAGVQDRYITRFATLRDLFTFAHYVGDGTYVDLPNGHKLDIVKYYDQCCVDYLKTYALLRKAGIYAFGMHMSNIFLEWGDGAPNIILGDVGEFIAKPRSDVIIVGAVRFVEEQIDSINQRIEMHNGAEFIYKSRVLLSPEQFDKSKASKIFKVPPYCDSVYWETLGVSPKKEYIAALKPAEELLKYFE